MGLVPARVCGRQAVGIALTERLKLRRQMAVAAGKKDSVSLSLFVEVNGLDVEEDLSTVDALQCGWADGEESSRRRGESRSLKCRHGDR